MIRAAVLGSPISHSRSPLLHNAAYARLGVEGEYGAIEVDENGVAHFLRSAYSDGYTGFSLTMPLKDIVRDHEAIDGIEASTGLNFTIDSDAQVIGSINTLLRTDSGYRALSTDYLAFTRLFSPLSLGDAEVIVLGGGGTARAAIGALVALGVRTVHVHLRGGSSSRHAAGLLARFPTIALVFHEFGTPLSSCALLINSTPQGAADGYAEQLNNVRGAGTLTLFESLYHPWPTRLAAAAIGAGLPTFSGHDLLVEQALDQIALMTGKEFDYDDMREFLRSL